MSERLEPPMAGANGHPEPEAGAGAIVAHGAGGESTRHPDGSVDWEEPPVAAKQLAELFTALDKAARARRLYQENNPVYQTFNANLRELIARLWEQVQSLPVIVEENSFKTFGNEFGARDGRDGLPFLFFRDGVRLMTFLPGFEDEVDRFLQVVDSARQFGPKASDDIVTLLWEEEFASFQYSYVDLLAETVTRGPNAGEAQRPPPSVDRSKVERLVEGKEPEDTPPAVQQGEPPVATAVLPENFVETTYFLEPEEVEKLRREVEIEWNRDVRSAVLDALFDRLEDETVADRHGEIIRILGQLLPAFLGRGDLGNATKIVVEVGALLEAGQLAGEEKDEALRLLRELNDAQVLSGLLGSLDDGSIDPGTQELATFLSYLGAEAMPLLLRTAERTGSEKLKERMWPALEAMGRKYPRALASEILSPDLAIAYGAARLTGRTRLAEARDTLVTLFRKADAAGRRVAVEALAAIGDAGALSAVQDAINDPDREVRITAARALGNATSNAARERLRASISSKELRDADLTEMMAFFEAYGTIAVEEDIGALDRLLNGRRLLGRESPETRSCAAMALGRMSSQAARESLRRAADDPHPLVRNAVNKALAAPRRYR
ncbi:MAG: HEAT repeat domain-containing protein [Longimicrobiales bacterium]